MSRARDLPRISVITPSLNQGRYLRQCIESVLSQGYKNLELLVIDGGSKDESVAVIREYAKAITYWVSEPDRGQSNAINKGFARATGDLVAWLNADDFYLPKALERVSDAYRSDGGAPFYFGDGLRVDEAGTVMSNFFPTQALRFDRRALVMGLNYILQPSTFINRRMLEQVGYLDEGLHYGMDSDLWMRLSGVGEPRMILSPLSATREYGTTKTASGSFGRVEELRQISMKHSGLPMTPGVLLYLLDTLHRFVQQEQGVFPAAFANDVIRFWNQTQRLLEPYDAAPDGFPRESPVAAAASPGMGAEEQIETLTGWLHEARAAHATLQSAHASAIEQIETLTGWVHEARDANAALQRAMDEQKKSHAHQVAELDGLHASAVKQIETLTGWVHEARDGNATLQAAMEEQKKVHADQVAQLNGLHASAVQQIETLTGWVHEARATSSALQGALDEQKKAWSLEVAALQGQLARPLLKFALGLSNIPERLKERFPGGAMG